MAAATHLPVAGERVGRYHLSSLIAMGGMAAVFRAEAVGIGGFRKPVAVKIMLPHIANDAKFASMFLDEGTLAAAIRSEHVVETYDLGRADDGTLFLAMELVEGASLREVVAALGRQDRALTLDAITYLVRCAAAGLAAIHAAVGADGAPLDIVHRDVSPHNILLGVDGSVKLADLGIAKAARRLTHTDTGEFKGKVSYSAPEGLVGDEVDARADLFSLGVVAWELCARRRLFRSGAHIAGALEVIECRVPPVRSIAPWVPEDLGGVIDALLAKSPSDRPVSAQAVVDLLGADAGSQSALAAHVRDSLGVSEGGGSREGPARSRSPSAPGLSRALPGTAPASRIVGAGTALAAVVLFAFVAFVITRIAREPRRELDDSEAPRIAQHEAAGDPPVSVATIDATAHSAEPPQETSASPARQPVMEEPVRPRTKGLEPPRRRRPRRAADEPAGLVTVSRAIDAPPPSSEAESTPLDIQPPHQPPRASGPGLLGLEAFQRAEPRRMARGEDD